MNETKSRIQGMVIEWIDPATLTPYEKNPRINDGAVEAVWASIEEFGWKQPLVVDKDRVIVVGHTRWKAAMEHHCAMVPVVIASDLTEAQIKAYRIADNRTGELSEWDFTLLPIELEDLKQMDFKMDDFGFSDAEFDALLKEKDPVSNGRTDPDAVPEADVEKPDSQRGMVYRLGDHRLICGDATDVDDVRRLMGPELADLWLTDPPYNVAVENSAGLTIMNDNMDGEKFEKFLKKSFCAAVIALKPGAAFYIFHSDNYGLAFRQAVGFAGLTLRQNLIWAKNGFTLGRQDYQWAHEACLYGWKSGAAHSWYNDRSQRTIIDIEGQPFTRREDGKYQLKVDNRYFVIEPEAVCVEENTTIIAQNKPLKCDLHPTMKPVEMLIRLMKNSTRRGDVVFDDFGGSGSTVIAAEQTGRKARVMELDEHYADVIRKRWGEFRYGEGCDWRSLTPPVPPEAE